MLTRFVAMKAVMLIIYSKYIINYAETKGALFVRVCSPRLYGLVHTASTRPGRGSLSLATTAATRLTDLKTTVRNDF